MSVMRGSVAQDGFDELDGADTKALVESAFIDQFGQEPGVAGIECASQCW